MEDEREVCSMKKISFILLLSSHIACGQLLVIVFETFDNNRYGWREHETPEHKVGLRNGKYFMETSTSGWISSVMPYIEPKKDFSLEATFTQVSGKQDNSMGLIW